MQILDSYSCSLGEILRELRGALRECANQLDLNFDEQLQEIAEAMAAHNPFEDAPTSELTRATIISRVLSVAVNAFSKFAEGESHYFASCRKSLETFKEELKQLYMAECIPY